MLHHCMYTKGCTCKCHIGCDQGNKIMLISELGYYIGSPTFNTDFAIRSANEWNGLGVTADFRHNDAKNTVFMDGHVGSNRLGTMDYNLYIY